ncbi:MAG: glycerophosphodiester phosphodiesterase family protein [Gammaproteobacteria bacterium]|nr:glycerophosphodiester phosphodiesterase family protein [Gammaproteobacteria bacterium]
MLRFRLELAAQWLADQLFAAWPRSRPSRARLQACKIISHRGEHDNRRVRENTLAAFDAARAGGVWGIEFDLRWTRDYQPVVIHDPDARRVFGVDLAVAEVDFAELRRRLPEVPTLAEVIERYGRAMHLMMELKRDSLTDHARKRATLQALFAPLTPGEDYHVLALAPELFTPMDFAGEPAFIVVAELNVAAISAQAMQRDFGGIGGQYLLLGNRLVQRHATRGQHVGTGFIASRFCLYRELNRGIEWIYSNHACRLAAIRRRLLD